MALTDVTLTTATAGRVKAANPATSRASLAALILGDDSADGLGTKLHIHAGSGEVGTTKLVIVEDDEDGALFEIQENGVVNIGKSGQLTTVKGDFQVDGIETIVGNTTFSEDIDLGDASDDLISFVGRVDTSILSNSANSVDLGSTSLEWRALYLGDGGSSGLYMGQSQEWRQHVTSSVLTVDGSAAAAGAAGFAYDFNGSAGGAGTAGSSPTAAGAGGAITIDAGAGGAGDGTDTGSETGGDAGTGGALTIKSGIGGAGDAGTEDPAQPGAGGLLTIQAADGGAGAGTSDNSNGGALTLDAGAAGTGGSGSAGTAGVVNLGVSNASAVNISKAGATTTVSGSLTVDQNLVVSGNVDLGSDANDTISFLGDVDTSITVDADGTLDLGATGGAFRALYLGEDASSGLHLGLDENFRLWYDESSSNDLKLEGTAAAQNGAGFGIDVDAGAGGVAGGASAGGVGGSLDLRGGVGGASASGGGNIAAAGGTADLSGGVGGASTASTHDGADGGDAQVTGGVGGVGSSGQNSGAGGDARLLGGAAGAAGGGTQANGGDADVDGGLGATNGSVTIGTTNAEAVTIGRSGKTTTVSGALTVTEATQLNSTLTVGVDDTGYDVKFFGATSGNYMEWDESADQLNVIGTLKLAAAGVGVTTILDEDNMASDSATALATQQSIKAYVDSQVGGIDTLSELTDTSISGPAGGELIIYDGSDSWDNVAISGDATLAANGALTLASSTSNLTALTGGLQVSGGTLNVDDELDLDAAGGTLGVNDSYAAATFDCTATEAASGTHARISTVEVGAPDITTGDAALTAAASLYIAAAPTEAVNNYALWVDSGAVQLDGTLDVEGLATASAGLTVEGGALTITNQAITQTTGGQVTFAGNVDADAGLDVSGSNLTLASGIHMDVSAGATDVLMVDNSAAALVFKEGSNIYLELVTTDGSEKIKASKNLHGSSGLLLDTSGTLDCDVASDFSEDMTLSDGANIVVSDTTNTLIAGIQARDLASKTLSLTNKDGGTVPAAKVVYLHTDASSFKQADADAAATAYAIGVTAESINNDASGRVYTQHGMSIGGFSSLTIGSAYYLSQTAGGITTTAPSAVGTVVYMVGVADTATSIVFMPQFLYEN